MKSYSPIPSISTSIPSSEPNVEVPYRFGTTPAEPACPRCVPASHALGRRGNNPTGFRCGGARYGLMQEFMRLCSAQHKRTYVVFAVMLRSGLITIGDAGLSPAYTT